MKPNTDEKNLDTDLLNDLNSNLSDINSDENKLKNDNNEISFLEEKKTNLENIHSENSQSELKNELKSELDDFENENNSNFKELATNKVKMNGHNDSKLENISILTYDQWLNDNMGIVENRIQNSLKEKVKKEQESQNKLDEENIHKIKEESQSELKEESQSEIKEESQSEIKVENQNEKKIHSQGENSQEKTELSNESHILIEKSKTETNKKIEEENNNEFVEVSGNCDLLKRTIKKVNDNNLLSETGCELIINLESRNHETNEIIKSETFENFTIYVGDFDVIQGVDIVIKDMRVGEIAEVLIKPNLAYGNLGKKPDVPPNCTILSKIEILENRFLDSMNCRKFEDLEKYMNICIRKKERGNFFFNRGQNEIALHCYNKSGEILDLLGVNLIDKHTELSNLNKTNQDEIKKNEIDKELEKLSILSEEFMKTKLIVYNNISAVQIKMKLYNEALISVNNALKIDSENLKALFRKATILKHKGELDLAIKTLEYAILFEPQNKKFLNDLKSLKISRSKEIRREKALYQKMMNSKKVVKKKEESYNNLTLISGGLIITGLVLGSYYIYKKMNK